MKSTTLPDRYSRWQDYAADAIVKGLRGTVQQSPFKDPWEFLSRAVWTRDEASRSIRRFPADMEYGGERCFAYLEYLTGERSKHRVRAYEKSRRMLITWWLVALYLYDLMTLSNDLSAVASDKLGKSAYLLGPQRMEIIYSLIPPVSQDTERILRSSGMDVGPFREEVWPNKPVVEFSGKEGEGWTIAKCAATNSQIMAMASGSSQMQQYTFSKVLMDEFPRWQWQQESWRNIQPTTQGGGCVDIVCTAELGAFAYDLLYDQNVH